MNTLVKKFFGGVSGKISIKSKELHRQELLRDPVAIELFALFYKEGSNFIWHPSASMTFDEFLEYLKK